VTTVILLRGLTREGAHWGSFPSLLAERIAGLRVVPVDLPGNGRANALRSPSRVDDMARAARQEVQRLKLEPPYLLVAMSLGAMVAVEWAVQEPPALGGCVLINTSMRPFSPPHRRLRPANYATLLRIALAIDSERWREEAIVRLTTSLAPAPEDLSQQWAEIRRHRPVTTPNAMRQLVAAARYRAPPRAPGVPFLVLSSRGDRLVDPDCSMQLARAWQVEHAVHPRAGHDLCLDDGPWVACQLERWFARLDSGARGLRGAGSANWTGGSPAEP
jgi:pimeloyl-ACP methyl ester carboxylesterase